MITLRPEWSRTQQRCTVSVGSHLRLVFKIFPHTKRETKFTMSHFWRIRRPILVASRMLTIILGNDTIIEIFIEEIKDFSRSMWTGTVLHEPWSVPTVIEGILNRPKFTHNVHIIIVWRRENGGLISYFPNAPVLLIDETVEE